MIQTMALGFISSIELLCAEKIKSFMCKMTNSWTFPIGNCCSSISGLLGFVVGALKLYEPNWFRLFIMLSS